MDSMGVELRQLADRSGQGQTFETGRASAEAMCTLDQWSSNTQVFSHAKGKGFCWRIQAMVSKPSIFDVEWRPSALENNRF
jgi:hypothetical protein